MANARLTERARPWWTLAGACAGLFVLMLDSTVVALALPSIQRDLGASAAELQWVQNSYLLTLSVLVITAGRLGDMFGRKLIYLLGLGAFAAGSAVSATASSEIALIFGRVLQGAGGSAMLGLSLAIASNAFPTERQAAALGIWAAVSAIALAIGPLVGGVLIHAASWRWIFWINLPFIALGAAIMLAAARESRDQQATHRVDVPGVLALMVGSTMVVLALVESDAWGWGSPATLGLLAGGLVVVVLFWLIEHRVAQPLVEFSLFRNGPYFGASAAAFTLVGAYWAVIFFEPQYIEKVLGNSAVEAGILILPLTAPMAFISPFAGGLIARFGARALMTVGMLCAAGGLAIQTGIGPDSSYPSLLPGLLLFGIAIGLVYAPMSTAAMAAMPRAKAGIAAGVLAMNRVFAGAMGLAVVGAVFQALRSERIGEGEREAFAFALANSLWILVGLTAAGALLTWMFVPSKPGPKPAPEDLRHHMHHRRFHL